MTYPVTRYVQNQICNFVGAGFWFEQLLDEEDFQYRFFDGHSEPCSLFPDTIKGNMYLTEIKPEEDLVWKIEPGSSSRQWNHILLNIDENTWTAFFKENGNVVPVAPSTVLFLVKYESIMKQFGTDKWTLFKNSQNSLDKPISSEYNARCGICGSKAYMGFNTLECSNHKCLNNPKNFKDRVYGCS